MEEDILRNNGRILLVSVVILLAFVGFANASQELYPGYTSGHGIVPVLVLGNPTCDEVAGCDDGVEYKIEPADGNYNQKFWVDGDHWIDITETPENVIAWNSNFDIKCIFMKGASGADVYYCTDDYPRDDSNMSPPINPSGAPAAISHIILCFEGPTEVPEFPAWFLSLTSIAGLVGLFIALQRK